MPLPYTPQTWVNKPDLTTPISAARMNNIENGLGDLSDFLVDGSWATWTPTFTNASLGNGSVTARFQVVGKLVTVSFVFTLGSTSTVGTVPTWTLPVAATSSTNPVFDAGYILDAGTARFRAWVSLQSTTAFTVSSHVVSSTRIIEAQTTAAVPMTWTTGDAIRVMFSYETP